MKVWITHISTKVNFIKTLHLWNVIIQIKKRDYLEDLQLSFFEYLLKSNWRYQWFSSKFKKPIINNKEKDWKIKWIGKPSQLGYYWLLTNWTILKYKNKDGGKYTQFSKDLLEIFEIQPLSKPYPNTLNIDTENHRK
jgi:hypothetical protein